MTKMKASQLRKGNVITYNGELCKVTESTHVTPGKGPAFMQVKMKRLADGIKQENRFRPDEHVFKEVIETKDYQYLYEDGDSYYFMNLEDYEQIHINIDLIGDGALYLLPEAIVQIQFHQNSPIGIELPASVELKITETEPAMRGATVSGSYKPATMETGLVIQIPPFLEVGETVRIDTRDGKYLDRVK